VGIAKNRKAILKHWVLYSLFAGLAIALVILHLALPKLVLKRGMVGEDFGFQTGRVSIFLSSPTAEVGNYNYSVQIEKGFLPIQRIIVEADECLNKVEFFEKPDTFIKSPQNFDCLQSHTFDVEVPTDIQSRIFDLRANITSGVQNRFFRVTLKFGLLLYLLLGVCGTLGAGVVFYLVRKEENFIRYLLPSAFLFYFANFLRIDFDKWAYDAVGHLDHVKVILKGSLLAKDICWECFQPPLAYWSAAVLYLLGAFTQALSVGAAARIVSLIGFVVFLYYGMKYLQLYLNKGWPRALVSAIIIFLPSSLLHSMRVGNESLFYALFMAAIYYLARFVRLKFNTRDLQKFAWLTVVALFTKASAIVLYPIVGLALYLEKKLKLWRILMPLYVAIPVFYLMQKYKVSLLHRLGDINYNLQLQNQWRNIIGIDIADLIHNGFTNAWSQHGGRRYFFNYYYKTAFWGEFHWGELVEPAARTWNIFCFFFFLLLFRGAERTKDPSLRYPLAIVGTCVLATMAFRIYYHMSPMQDFRFLFPVVFPAGVLAIKYAEANSKEYCLISLWTACALLVAVWTSVYCL
jgi:hypothetical protein